MTKKRVIEVLRQYLPFGNVAGGELRLPPRLAFHLATELGDLGIVNLGVDGWYYVPNEHGLVQDLAVDFFVGDEVLANSDAAQQSALAIQAYLQNNLPEHIVFVSFTLDYPIEWQAEISKLFTIKVTEA